MLLNRRNENKTHLHIIIKSKVDWIVHIINGKGILTAVLEGRVEVESKKGRKRLS